MAFVSDSLHELWPTADVIHFVTYELEVCLQAYYGFKRWTGENVYIINQVVDDLAVRPWKALIYATYHERYDHLELIDMCPELLILCQSRIEYWTSVLTYLLHRPLPLDAGRLIDKLAGCHRAESPETSFVVTMVVIFATVYFVLVHVTSLRKLAVFALEEGHHGVFFVVELVSRPH